MFDPQTAFMSARWCAKHLPPDCSGAYWSLLAAVCVVCGLAREEHRHGGEALRACRPAAGVLGTGRECSTLLLMFSRCL